jgi:hypothetical protein
MSHFIDWLAQPQIFLALLFVANGIEAVNERYFGKGE